MAVLFPILFFITGFANTEASVLLYRDANRDDGARLSPMVVALVIVGLALAGSCLMAFCLYSKYNPTTPSTPLYTLPTSASRLRGAIRIQSRLDRRGGRPVQGASPFSSLSLPSRAPEEGARIVSIRGVPVDHTRKTRMTAPAMGSPPPARSSAALNTV
ncbi:hypothetical protein CVT26_009430 [Gymnopilus dilepis]|uniref:Uncharacterized protein n=1 Tax=Gymnopilus dilepis TaxID=231916 RepID=A0A409YIG3_9AGAR|nr:hypothetical protein CVT26_009430 [Gymnopilus dilepis]